MPDFSEFEDKAKQLASEHPEQVDEGLKRAGDFADQRTGGRFGDEIQQGEQRAEDYLGSGQGGQGGQGSQDQGGGQYGQQQGGQDQYGQGQGGGQGGQNQYGQDQGGGQYGQDQGGQDQGGGQDQYGQDQGGQDQGGQDQGQGGSY